MAREAAATSRRVAPMAGSPVRRHVTSPVRTTSWSRRAGIQWIRVAGEGRGMRGDLGGGSRGIRRSTCRREREIFFFDMEQHRERDEEEEEENREKRWEADRWAFRPHQRIVHIGTSSQPDRWGLLVSFLVFATKLDNQDRKSVV